MMHGQKNIKLQLHVLRHNMLSSISYMFRHKSAIITLCERPYSAVRSQPVHYTAE
jgi:hypothetical protein